MCLGKYTNHLRACGSCSAMSLYNIFVSICKYIHDTFIKKENHTYPDIIRMSLRVVGQTSSFTGTRILYRKAMGSNRGQHPQCTSFSLLLPRIFAIFRYFLPVSGDINAACSAFALF